MPQTTFGSIIRHLLDEKLTSLKDLEEITGRGTSTIYRWMNEETEPHFTDMRLLVRRLPNPMARRTLVAMLTSDLPIVVSWVGDDEFVVQDSAGAKHDGHDLLDRTIVALDCVTHIIAEEHEAVRSGDLSAAAFAHLVTMMDDAVRHITSSKNLLQQYTMAKAPREEEPRAPFPGPGKAPPLHLPEVAIRPFLRKPDVAPGRLSPGGVIRESPAPGHKGDLTWQAMRNPGCDRRWEWQPSPVQRRHSAWCGRTEMRRTRLCSTQPLSNDLARSFGLEHPEGVLLADVLEPGDIVTQVGRRSVSKPADLLGAVASCSS